MCVRSTERLADEEQVGHSQGIEVVHDRPVDNKLHTSTSVRGGAREEVEHNHPGDDQRYPDDARQVERFAPEQHPVEDGAGCAEPRPDSVGDAERYLLEREP